MAAENTPAASRFPISSGSDSPDLDRPDWLVPPPGVEISDADVAEHLREIETPSEVVPESLRVPALDDLVEDETTSPPATSTGEMLCALCGKPIASKRLAHRRVIGWEKRREQGGTNAVRIREPLAEWAHDLCVDRAASGVSPLQETIA